jgi:predicted TIM-barrel fold metal-dependent hydrolase
MTNGKFDPSAFTQRTYAGVRALAELPYFELTDRGLLKLRLDDLDGGIDGHVHFALNALNGPKPDILISTAETRYYMSTGSPISLEKYMGLNQTQEDLDNTIMSMLNMLTPAGSSLTATHTIPNLLEEMDLLHIEKAVVLPIAYGFPYGDDITEWYLDAIEKSGKQQRFIVCGSVKPTLPGSVEKIRQFKLKGVRGIKVHPNMALFTPDDKLAWAFYEECSRLKLPLLIHCGLVGKESADPGQTMGYTGQHADIKYFREPISAFPGLRFVLCHSGGLQNEQAIAIASDNRNVWMDIQGQSVSNIQRMIKKLGPERLMFGSDWPFFPVATLLARLLIATEGDKKVRKMIYSENARRFWSEA